MLQHQCDKPNVSRRRCFWPVVYNLCIENLIIFYVADSSNVIDDVRTKFSFLIMSGICTILYMPLTDIEYIKWKLPLPPKEEQCVMAYAESGCVGISFRCLNENQLNEVMFSHSGPAFS
jgi:hypothetical protein